MWWYCFSCYIRSNPTDLSVRFEDWTSSMEFCIPIITLPSWRAMWITLDDMILKSLAFMYHLVWSLTNLNDINSRINENVLKIEFYFFSITHSNTREFVLCIKPSTDFDYLTIRPKGVATTEAAPPPATSSQTPPSTVVGVRWRPHCAPQLLSIFIPIDRSDLKKNVYFSFLFNLLTFLFKPQTFTNFFFIFLLHFL